MSVRVMIYRAKDDPMCLRASIGGTEEVGYYCTFRGDRAKIFEMLRTVLAVIEHVPDDMPIDVKIPPIMVDITESPGGGKSDG
jgi:hypothetical protein